MVNNIQSGGGSSGVSGPQDPLAPLLGAAQLSSPSDDAVSLVYKGGAGGLTSVQDSVAAANGFPSTQQYLNNITQDLQGIPDPTNPTIPMANIINKILTEGQGTISNAAGAEAAMQQDLDEGIDPTAGTGATQSIGVKGNPWLAGSPIVALIIATMAVARSEIAEIAMQTIVQRTQISMIYSLAQDVAAAIIKAGELQQGIDRASAIAATVSLSVCAVCLATTTRFSIKAAGQERAAMKGTPRPEMPREGTLKPTKPVPAAPIPGSANYKAADAAHQSALKENKVIDAKNNAILEKRDGQKINGVDRQRQNESDQDFAKRKQSNDEIDGRNQVKMDSYKQDHQAYESARGAATLRAASANRWNTFFTTFSTTMQQMPGAVTSWEKAGSDLAIAQQNAVQQTLQASSQIANTLLQTSTSAVQNLNDMLGQLFQMLVTIAQARYQAIGAMLSVR